MALNRALRLRKSSDYQKVRQQGRVVTSRLLLLAWTTNGGVGTRIGFVVSKRIAKHAVDRNYAKRLLSEAIRPVISMLPTDCDIVIIVRSSFVGVTLPRLTQDVTTLLDRARLLKLVQTPDTRS